MAMRYLIKKGAKVDAKDNEGATPLHKAAFSGEVKAVTLVRRIRLIMQVKLPLTFNS